MVIAIDSETCLIMPGCRAPPLVCVTAVSSTMQELFKWDDPELFEFLRDAFEKETTTGANFAYDLAVFIRAFPELERCILGALEDGRVRDTQMTEKLLDLREGKFRFEEDEEGTIHYRGYSLNDISKRYGLGSKKWDEWKLRYTELRHEPLENWPRAAVGYAITDAVLTSKIDGLQQKKNPPKNAVAQMQAHMMLHFISCRGIRTSHDRVAQLKKEAQALIDSLEPALFDAGLLRFEKGQAKRRVKEAVKRMAKLQGCDAPLTAKGEELKAQGHDVVALAKREGKFVSVNATACAETDDAALQAYAKYTQAVNLMSGSIKDYERGAFIPIQPRFEPLMETGRTACRAPNIQNTRRVLGIRECFVPRDGYVFLDTDVDLAELHSLAEVCYHLFGKSALGDALNAGLDVHLWLGSKIVGREYDYEAYAAGDEQLKAARQFAKAPNFGFPGGCGATRFVGIAKTFGHEIDYRTAHETRQMWFATWPEMKDFFEYVSQCRDENGWYYVKQHGTDRVRSRATFTAACNSHFQGLTSDAIKAVGWEIFKRQRLQKDSALHGTFIVNMIHDEYLLECPKEQVHEAGAELKEVVENTYNKFVPRCPTTAQVIAMDCWSKRWKDPKFDRGGRLVPWELQA